MLGTSRNVFRRSIHPSLLFIISILILQKFTFQPNHFAQSFTMLQIYSCRVIQEAKNDFSFSQCLHSELGAGDLFKPITVFRRNKRFSSQWSDIFKVQVRNLTKYMVGHESLPQMIPAFCNIFQILAYF